MKLTTQEHFPRMRQQRLIVDDLPDEVLVYDLDRQTAHCLNHSAALVWRCCDGQSSPADIARSLTGELDAPFAEELVLHALSQLEKLHLLERTENLPAPLAQLSRRQMVRRLGLAAAVAVPIVTSIVAPTPAQAGTCTASGNPCNPLKVCCSPLGCNPGSPPRCF